MRNSLEVYKGGRERVRERRERGSEKTWRRGENQTLTVYKARGTRVRVRRKRVKWLGGKACQYTMQEKRERERGGGERLLVLYNYAFALLCAYIANTLSVCSILTPSIHVCNYVKSLI